MESLAIALGALAVGVVALFIYVELLRRRIDELNQIAASQSQFNKSATRTIAQIVKGMK